MNRGAGNGQREFAQRKQAAACREEEGGSSDLRSVSGRRDWRKWDENSASSTRGDYYEKKVRAFVSQGKGKEMMVLWER